MMRLLRQLDDLDAGRPARRRGGINVLARRTATTAVLVGILGAGALSVLHVEYGVTLGRDGFARARPLGQPPDVLKGVGTFAFIARQSGTVDEPVAYDPCRAVEYAINSRLGPPGGTGLIEQAVAEIERATGLVFERIPDTDRPPQTSIEFSLSPRREPVVVGWTTPDELQELEGPVAGLGGSSSTEHTSHGDRVYTTGMVALDAPQLIELMARPDGRAQTRAIIMHELAHLVGLGHVDDPRELMYEENLGQTTFGPGDREGLAALGAGQCFH